MPTETALEELIPGARNAVETCLAIQPGERVTLITDRTSEEVAASLARAIEMRGASCEEFLLEDLAPRPLARAPKPVLDSLERADAGIRCPANWARAKISSASSNAGRFATRTWSASLPKSCSKACARTTRSLTAL